MNRGRSCNMLILVLLEESLLLESFSNEKFGGKFSKKMAVGAERGRNWTLSLSFSKAESRVAFKCHSILHFGTNARHHLTLNETTSIQLSNTSSRSWTGSAFPPEPT